MASRAIHVLFFSMVLVACGGGGGASTAPPPQPALTLSMSKIDFSAKSVLQALAPAPVTLQGTVNGNPSGTLYVLITVGNGSIATAGNFQVLSNTTAQVTITPAIPSSLGAGSFQTTLTIRACLNDSTCNTGQLVGSPATVAVNYVVGSTVQRDSVTPRIVSAQTPSTVILRGAGFDGVSSVTVGGVSVTAFSRVSASELRLSLPSLPSGTHSFSINNGAIAFADHLSVVNEDRYPAAIIDYPDPVDQSFGGAEKIFYDAQNKALFAVAKLYPASKLYRFTYSGGWSATANLDITGYTDIDVSPDGSRIYLVYPAQITVLDSSSLATLETIGRPSSPAGFYDLFAFSLANDGLAIVTMSMPGSGFVPLYALSTTDKSFTAFPGLFPEEMRPTSSRDGGIVNLDSYSSYVASTGMLVQGNLGSNAVTPRWVAPEFDSTTFAFVGYTVNQYVNGQPVSIGRIADTTLPFATTTDIYSDRAYVLDSTRAVRAWDIAIPAVNGLFSPVSAPLVFSSGNTGVTNDFGIVAGRSIDGRTGFVASRFGIAVVPEN